MDTETLFRTLFWILLGGVMAMRMYFSRQVRRYGERLMPDRAAIAREGRVAFGIRFVAFFALMAFLVLYGLNVAWLAGFLLPLPPWLRWTGFALGLVSLVWWTWTQSALGVHWSAQLQLRNGHRLVTTGPYARVRHPLYTAMLGFATALVLVTAHWGFVVVGIFSIGLLVLRVPREEQMMLDEFGAEYAAYMQRTGRFFPRLQGRGAAEDHSGASEEVDHA
jgi:protein-S-isoprenylcysteine O-methyltransferase Ste14